MFQLLHSPPGQQQMAKCWDPCHHVRNSRPSPVCCGRLGGVPAGGTFLCVCLSNKKDKSSRLQPVHTGDRPTPVQAPGGHSEAPDGAVSKWEGVKRRNGEPSSQAVRSQDRSQPQEFSAIQHSVSSPNPNHSCSPREQKTLCVSQV